MYSKTLFLLLLTACAGSVPPVAPPIEVPSAEQIAADTAKFAVNAPDRSEADRALDAGRQPEELLRWAGITPGMRVGELMSGGGYTAELLARAVGPGGQVYGINSPFILERFAQAPWTARLEKPVNANIVRLDRDFDDPFPDEVRDLDRVLSILVYHDFVWMETDRASMNADIFASLRPGGLYVVVDHSAEAGSGLRDVQTLHRIDQPVVRAEIEAAGFEFVSESEFLRNPEDTRDWSASPGAAGERRGTSDRFAMIFQRP